MIKLYALKFIITQIDCDINRRIDRSKRKNYVTTAVASAERRKEEAAGRFDDCTKLCNHGYRIHSDA